MPKPTETITSGIARALHIGQRVRHSDYQGKRVTVGPWL